MLFWGNKKTISHSNLGKYIKSHSFQRLLVGIITIILAFTLVETGAAPKKYRLFVGTVSTYDINAPRDIENKLKTEQNAKAAADAVEPVMKEIVAASFEVYKSMDDFITLIEEARKSVVKKLEASGFNKKDVQYGQLLDAETEAAVTRVSNEIKLIGIPLSVEQLRYLISKASDDEFSAYSKICRDIITNAMKYDITDENLLYMVNQAQNEFELREINQDFKNIGGILVKAILKPNRIVDSEVTKKRKEEVYSRQENVVKILKGERIISYGELVTEDKYMILDELKLIEAAGRFDFVFSVGILFIILLLTLVLLLYLNRFCKNIFYNRNDILILCLNILLVLTIARWVSIYSPLAIPIFIATMTISIILDLKLAIMVNFILAAAIGLMTKGNMDFVYMSLISGTLSAFLVSKANQRSRLSISGLIIALVNAVIIVCLGLINKSGFTDIVNNVAIVFINGILSIVLTIGMLPFWESTFNAITPMKLLELANANQPLLKRLLMEAPGTYHHSLMVGNLAEVATEAIGGDALLARVGAYFHDIGKLTRPNFFKENQLSENPHDKITPNLSTLIITSHATDGTELAEKYKIPLAIKDIISQHHGTTLVAYFYHKASKGDKGDQVKPENFRYEGPRPSSKEAAVVMLADSVEAAVRSMIDKTEGKIEGLVRKIVKDKLDDGQLDLCELTLKDLDIIAKSFVRVFSGYFHERQQYPDIQVKEPEIEKIEDIEQIDINLLNDGIQEERSISNENTN